MKIDMRNIQITDKGAVICSNGVLRQMAIGLAFYFYEDPELNTRKAILKILSEYCGMYGDQLRWTTNPNTARWEALKGGYKSYDTPEDWLMNAGRGSWQFVYHGGVKGAEASDIEIVATNAGLSRGVKKAFGSIYCHFPTDLVSDEKKAADYIKMVRRWASLLKPFHGYSGYTMANDHHLPSEGSYALLVDSLYACRMPGINLNRFIYHDLQLEKEIKGADWLTFLSGYFIEKLGGESKLKSALATNPEVTCSLYDGGAMFVAGDRPQLGEKGWSDPVMEPYRIVGRLVEPVRKKDHWRYCPNMEPGEELQLPFGCKYLDTKQTQAWLARFSHNGY